MKKLIALVALAVIAFAPHASAAVIYVGSCPANPNRGPVLRKLAGGDLLAAGNGQRPDGRHLLDVHVRVPNQGRPVQRRDSNARPAPVTARPRGGLTLTTMSANPYWPINRPTWAEHAVGRHTMWTAQARVLGAGEAGGGKRSALVRARLGQHSEGQWVLDLAWHPRIGNPVRVTESRPGREEIEEVADVALSVLAMEIERLTAPHPMPASAPGVPSLVAEVGWLEPLPSFSAATAPKDRPKSEAEEALDLHDGQRAITPLVSLRLEAIGDNVRQSMREWSGVFDKALGDGAGEAFVGVPKSRAWVARITGLDGQFRFRRQFLQGQKDYSEANSAGSRGVFLYYALEEGYVYEISSPTSHRRTDRYFAMAQGGELQRMTEKEVEDWLSK